MECVAYMRVSTEKQAEEGNGLESQKRDIITYAGENEFIVKEWYVDDGYTGSNMNRPALKRLINDCYDKKIKNVIAFKLDRLSRSMIDGLYIIEKIFVPNGVTFKCVHDTISYDSPMEQAYTQMMAVFSQLDKNTMLLRMRGGMLERVKNGYWPGGGNNPFCYRYNRETGTLEQIPEKVELARKAMNLFMEGYSDERIQKILGFKTEGTVRNILTAKVNAGIIPYKGDEYKGLHQPVFTETEYLNLQEARKSRREKRYVQSQVNLLTGLCYCGECGCSMRYQKWGKTRSRIYCQSRIKGMGYLPNHNPGCQNVLTWADEIEAQVEEKILQISLNLKLEDMETKVSPVKVLNDRIDSLKTKLKRLYGIYADGNDTVVDMITELENEIKEVKKQIAEEEKKNGNKEDKILEYEKIKRIADVWGYIDKTNKNKILKSIIHKILIVNGNIEIQLKGFSSDYMKPNGV